MIILRTLNLLFLVKPSGELLNIITILIVNVNVLEAAWIRKPDKMVSSRYCLQYELVLKT